MSLPDGFIDSLTVCAGFSKSAFLEAHQLSPAISVRCNPYKISKIADWSSREKYFPVPWCTQGCYFEERPVFTLDPLLHAGAYYVQEASSMFIHHVVDTLLAGEHGLAALDMCAAPGGKSTLLSAMHQFDFVLANEIISSRVGVLYENAVKWGSSKILISNNDPKDFEQLGELFDVVLVDAPCSGSGLFRKDEAAIQEWNTDLVNFCSSRQKRILHAAIKVLKPGGYLIYSTCSYSYAENEANLDDIISSGGVVSVPVTSPANWGIVESLSEEKAAYGYRFYPDKLKGEGFFCAVMQKTETKNTGAKFQIESQKPLKKIPELHGWIDAEGIVTTNDEGEVYAIPEPWYDFRNLLKKNLRLRKSGVKVGAIMKKGLVPDHELALSDIVSSTLQTMDLDVYRALGYLRKEEIDVDTNSDGTYLITYKGCGLGWAKVVQGRFKNNYPTGWRILMKGEPKKIFFNL